MSAVIMEVPIEQQALTVVEKAKAITVNSIVLRSEAGEMGRIIAALEKEAEEFFAPMKQAAAKTHKEICNKENAVLKPLLEAKRYLSGQIGAFDQKLEQERREEEARLQKEADDRADAEAARLAAEQAIEDAIALEQSGDVKGAEAVLNHPVPVFVKSEPVILQTQLPKVEGVSGSKNWKFRITDADKIPREYMVPDEKALGAVVRALKGKTNIPGIEVYPEGGARFKA